MNNRIRYTVNDVNNNRFYQMPTFLFEGEFKKRINNDAKILYSLLRDRHNLSIKNNWINESGEVYLIYTREDMADMLGISQPTLRNAINQLKEHGLMEEEHIGLNRANRIYLTTVILDITGVKNSFSPECKDLSSRNENILQSGVKNSFIQECKNLSPNYTNINKTNINKTNISYINQSIEPEQQKTEIFKNSISIQKLNEEIISTGFKSYEDLIYELQLNENVYKYPQSEWINTIKKVIWEMYYYDSKIKNRTIGRFDVVKKIQGLNIDIIGSAIDKIIDMSEKNRIEYPVPLLKTILFNEIDEYLSKIQAQVNYDLNNDFSY